MNVICKGIENGETSQIEAKLTNVVEKRVEKRREYFSLIDETQEINVRLYKKMISAGEKRASVYCKEGNEIESNKKSKNRLQAPDNNTNQTNRENNVPQASNNNTNQPTNKNEIKMLKNPQSVRRCKSASQKKRNLKRISRCPCKSPGHSSYDENNNVEQDDKMVEEDEYELALKWAHSILLKEYNRRCEIIDRNNGVTKLYYFTNNYY